MTAGKPGKHALAFILITILLDVIGFGIIIPVYPQLLVEVSGKDIHEAVTYGGWLMFLYAAMQFLCSPIMGNLSDRFGRRPVILIALAVFSADYLVAGLAPTLVWLFAARLVAGITGASFTPAGAYIADITPPEKRAANFGMIGAMWGIGFIIGPMVGGLLGEYGTRVPFFVASGLALVNLVYGFFVLPETLPKERRRPFRFASAHAIGTFREMRKFPLVFWLLTATMLFQFAHDVSPTTWNYYTMHKFGWTPKEIGLSLAAVGFGIAIVMAGGTRVITPRIGEARAAYIGFFTSTVSFLGYALVPKGWMVYLFIPIGCFIGLSIPALRSIMSNAMPPDRQGELQGAMTSVVMLVAIVSPVLWTHVFGYFSSPDAIVYFPGAAYVAGSALLFVCAFLVRGILRHFASPTERNPALYKQKNPA
jgi:MFS transporter, DHA1 family, tetracycline resistance protein